MRAFWVAATLFATGCDMAPTSMAATRPTTQCSKEETVIYSCTFGKKIGSLCAGNGALHYRFGALRKPGLSLSSNSDWENVRLGYVIGQGGGHQSHVRLTNGETHYIVYEGENGKLADKPGRLYSGITVVGGQRGDIKLAYLVCKRNAIVHPSMTEAARALAPAAKLDQLNEVQDGPFDGWF